MCNVAGTWCICNQVYGGPHRWGCTCSVCTFNNEYWKKWSEDLAKVVADKRIEREIEERPQQPETD
jgi:hypothetical protein